MRVALLTNILSPYRVPVFSRLAATPGWDLRIFVSAESEFDRSWIVDGGDLVCEKITGWSRKRTIRTTGPHAFEQVVTLHIPTGIPKALRRFQPDVVITSELGIRSALAIGYCQLNRIPCVIWSYNSKVSTTSAGALRNRLRRVMLGQADAVVGMGSEAREVLAELGCSGEKVFDAPNAHDHETCENVLANSNPEAAYAPLRATHGCRRKVALVVGRLVPMKGVPHMIEAWTRLPEPVRNEWTLLFVGSGPMKAFLEQEIANRPRGEMLHLQDVQPREVIAYYAGADLLIFPSLGDPWGLVVNEAFACGLPVLCSSLAGCAVDMMREGENGWLFDPNNAGAFLDKLQIAMAGCGSDAVRQSARETGLQFVPDVMASGIRRAVLYAAGMEGDPALESASEYKTSEGKVSPSIPAHRQMPSRSQDRKTETAGGIE